MKAHPRDLALHQTLAAPEEFTCDGGVGFTTGYLDNYTDEEHEAVEAALALGGLSAAAIMRDEQRAARWRRMKERGLYMPRPPYWTGFK